MYWAKIRHGSTPRTMWTPMSRCSGVPTSSAPIAVATPTAAGLVAPSGVERAGDLALAIEDVAALLDPAGHQHVAGRSPRRSSRSRPASSNLSQRADRLGFPGDGHSGGTLTTGLPSLHGKGVGLAARRAPQGARRLGRLLPRLRRGSRAGSTTSRPTFRSSAPSAAARCCAAVLVQRAVQLDLRGRLRVLRDAAA